MFANEVSLDEPGPPPPDNIDRVPGRYRWATDHLVHVFGRDHVRVDVLDYGNSWTAGVAIDWPWSKDPAEAVKFIIYQAPRPDRGRKEIDVNDAPIEFLVAVTRTIDLRAKARKERA